MLFKPYPLSRAQLDPHLLEEDRKSCKNYGPCGIGKRALYLNTFYINRRLYLPYGCITRVYKRIAMSKGGFTGKGIFASIPYLVVEYDDGSGKKEKQSNFKFERNIDLLLKELARVQPQIRQGSAMAEKRLTAQAAKEKALLKPELTDEVRSLDRKLERAQKYLENQKGFAEEMSHAARAKRTYDHRANPHYKEVAAAILTVGVVTLALGIYTFIIHGKGGIYFLLIGLMSMLALSRAHVLPIGRNNKRAAARRFALAQARAQKLVNTYNGKFPVPARYAHPIVLKRMRRIVEAGRAKTADEALEVLKADLKALNSSVRVEKWEYDEVVAIKSLFLLADYK